MPAALPIGTVKTWSRGRVVVKTSHHGIQSRRWQSASEQVSAKDRLAKILSDPKIERRRRRNQIKALKAKIPKSNRERARHKNRQVIREGQWYPVFHGPVTISMQLTEVTKSEEVTVEGLVAMLPFRTKHQAERWGQESWRPGVVAVRGVKLTNKEFSGYRRHIPDEGQAWTHEKTKRKMVVNFGKWGENGEES
jgi:hypothetical protein